MKIDHQTAQVARNAVAAFPRPEATLDDDWSEQTLARILSAPTPPAPSTRLSRGRRFGALALAVGTVGVGGVAYAVGGAPLPEYLSRSIFDQADQAGRSTPAMVQIADLTLPDGSRFAAWRGHNSQLDCSASTTDWDGTDGLGWASTTCIDISPGKPDLNRAHVSWAKGEDIDSGNDGAALYYPVLVGHAATPSTTRVVVTGSVTPFGSTINESLSVDPATGAFAAVLPDAEAHPFERSRLAGLTIRFLDSNGTEVESPARPFS